MSDRVRLTAPAKLNLFLHVVGRRADGHHLLQTVFQLLDFGDELEFRPGANGRIEFECNALDGVPPEENLVLRAAQALDRHIGGGPGARIRLRKRIPIGGGLGGGSSDAAATLLALNRLWKCELSLAELGVLGLRLGADVPVFVHGRSAWAEGVGEVLTPLVLPSRWYLVLRPACAVNTAAIFRDPELTRSTPLSKMAAFFPGAGHNDCEPVVRRLYPDVNRALDWLSGAGEARMSGTGSCVFAAFADEGSANEVAATVPENWTCFVTRGVDRSGVHEALDY